MSEELEAQWVQVNPLLVALKFSDEPASKNQIPMVLDIRSGRLYEIQILNSELRLSPRGSSGSRKMNGGSFAGRRHIPTVSGAVMSIWKLFSCLWIPLKMLKNFFPWKSRACGATRHGVILDTNAPETEHWWPIMSGETPLPDHIGREQALMLVKPDNWTFFTQPSGMNEIRDYRNELTGYEMNPECENFNNLMPTYYENMIRGKTKSWIDVYILNRLGTVEDGKSVYQGFLERTHVAKGVLEPAEGLEIIIGIDFGLTPAAVFAQRLGSGRWLVLRELVAQDMGAIRFAEQLRVTIARYYGEHEYKIFGDPSGDFRAQTDESTPFDILRGAGIRALPAPTNDPVIRIESVNSILSRMVDGEPGFLVDQKNCPVLKSGFLGGYHYRRLQISGEKYDDRPHKNKFSHVHDALQYAVVGAGEGRSIVRGTKALKPFQAKRDFNVFDRMRKRVGRNRGSRAI